MGCAVSDKANSNEYRVCERNLKGVETEYSIFAARYKFNSRAHMATFWYWRKNLWQRWEIVSFERELVWVHQVIDGVAEQV